MKKLPIELIKKIQLYNVHDTAEIINKYIEIQKKHIKEKGELHACNCCSLIRFHYFMFRIIINPIPIFYKRISR